MCRCIVRKDFLLMSLGGPVKLEMKMLSFARGEMGATPVEEDQASVSHPLSVVS